MTIHKTDCGDRYERAREMLRFLQASSLTSDLSGTLNMDYLTLFEAHRSLIVSSLLRSCGVRPEDKFDVLDFGYLHGLTQEFLHRDFPLAKITVCDRPESPIFRDAKYQETIKSRAYVSVVPCDISEAHTLQKNFRIIFLGEIIEHIDPTKTAGVLESLRKAVASDGVLIVTTPNAAGAYNCYNTFKESGNITHAPIEDQTHGYPHIHLWSPSVLNKTAKHFGWQLSGIEFYHGREAELFADLNRKWSGLKTQIVLRTIKFVADVRPKARGFFVAAFQPNRG